MIIRHITQVKFLQSIVADGFLDPSHNPKRFSSDKEYISFEKYTGSNTLVNLYIKFKNIKKEEAFELFFDSDLMEKDGLELVAKFDNGGVHTKLELKHMLTEEEYNSIGDYIFVRGCVSLKYLTEECRNKLESFIKTCNINTIS